MKINIITILTSVIILLCILISCVNYLITDNDVLYVFLSFALLIISVFFIINVEKLADYLSGRS